MFSLRSACCCEDRKRWHNKQSRREVTPPRGPQRGCIHLAMHTPRERNKRNTAVEAAAAAAANRSLVFAKTAEALLTSQAQESKLTTYGLGLEIIQALQLLCSCAVREVPACCCRYRRCCRCYRCVAFILDLRSVHREVNPRRGFDPFPPPPLQTARPD